MDSQIRNITLLKHTLFQIDRLAIILFCYEMFV